MRIAVVGTRGFPDVQGGVETYGEEMFPRLVARGCEVVTYARAGYVDPHRQWYRGVRLVPLPAPRHPYAEALLHSARAVRRASRDGADAVFFQGIGPSVYAPLARQLGMRVVVRHVGADYERAKWSPAARAFLRWCEAVALRNADAVVCVSPFIAADVRARSPWADVVTIPNGATIRATGRAGACVRFGVEPGRFFLTAGRLVPEKRLHDVVDAFAALEPRGWKLVIAGAGQRRDSYASAFVRRAAAVPGVVTTGALPRAVLAELYAHAGAFVLASEHEGLSLALLEALGNGLPCIASDIPANRALGLPDHWYTPAGDVAGLCAALAGAVTGERSRTEARAVGASVAATHDWSSIADATFSVFERVCRTGTGSGTAHEPVALPPRELAAR